MITLRNRGDEILMPTLTAQRLEEALKHQIAGRTAEAETIYREILATEPANERGGMHRLGLLTLWSGRQGEARGLIERAVAADEKDWKYVCALGLVLSALGHQDDAIAAFSRAGVLNPRAADVYAGWGTALQIKGDMPGAIRIYRRALELNPNHVETLNNLGNALSAEHKIDEAMELYQRGIALASQHRVMLNNMGTVLLNQIALGRGGGDFSSRDRA